ncbi:hypothetical protein [Methanosarcina sp. 2.H.A.1B.4]|uniref:hypothetical protein n=1 Tax=Methanosarcina sp. 2.H.A.1B.4 TaxID=1483600 RepID=UPI0006226A6C|nr:hypothetical protein [Methanosarcina sp. 2.H.A.1B.4]KKG13057.1 hypothetical protein EO92_07760 [Methanosarcina sp. 2.H.A.1B.4]
MSATNSSNDSISDIRLQKALDVINSDHEVIQLHKTTRAGATTSLCLASIFENKKFLIVTPTNKIIKDTILGNVKRLSTKENLNIIHIPNNFECLIIKSKIEENEDLENLPYLPLPEICGDDCEHFEKCPVTKILRDDEFDGIAITYHKLAAIMNKASLYPKSNASEILGKIYSADVVILDEAHFLAYMLIVALDMSNEHDFNYSQNLLRKINKKRGEFKNLWKLIFNYIQIIKNKDVLELEQSLNTYTNDNSYNTYSKHQARNISNSKKDLTFMDPRKSKFYFNYKTEKYELSKMEVGEKSSEILKELIELIECHKDLKITIEEILSIISMLNIIKADELTLHAQKTGNKDNRQIKTEICALNKEFFSAISDFLKIKNHDKKSKIILTSATFPDYDYTEFFNHGTNIHKYNFGDPLNTNEKMVIFCDSKSYSAFGKNSTYNCRKEIKKRCEQIMDIHDSKNCLIICKNKKEFNYWKDYFEKTKYNPQVTYYRAPEVMGVDSSKRVCILIGLGHIPAHSCDPIRDSAEKAQIAREEKMQIDVLQALSRAKDPNGKEISIVFALGCVERDIIALVSWGIGRKIEIIDAEVRGKSKEVNVHISGEEIPRPAVVRTKNWNETLIKSILSKNYLKSKPIILPYITHYYGSLTKNEFKINLKCSLLDLIINNSEVSTRTIVKHNTFSEKDMPLTDKLLSQHINGEKNVYFRFLMPGSKVNCIMFETNSEYDISHLKLYFDNSKLPYVIEKIGSLYRLWMFVNGVPAKVAKSFGETILKDIGFKLKGENKSVELYPKKTTINLHYKSSDELLKMPFGKDSKILVNGEFVDELTQELNIGIVDITDK